MAQIDLYWRYGLVITMLTMMLAKTSYGQSEAIKINDGITYFDVTSVKNITWKTASDRCISSAMNLCMMKDLCLSVPDTPRDFISRLSKDTYVPVGDAYNDWVYLGPKRTTNRCKRITEVAGPPVWKGQGCEDVIKPSKVFQRFCQSSSGIYCCQRPNKMANLIPHPVTVYISSYKENNEAFYTFSLKDESDALKSMRKVSEGLKKITLMSVKVDGKFEDPIYFCSRLMNENGKPVEYFHVSNKWCNWGWKLNFYLYASFTKLPDTQRYVAKAIGRKTKLRSQVSINDTVSHPSNDFTFYGPEFTDKTHVEFHAVKETDKTTCSGETALLTSRQGNIQSEDFEISSNNVKCRWKIRAPSNGVVKITFSKMKLTPKSVSSKSNPSRKKECNEEKLEVFGYGQFCGNVLPRSFVTIDNEIVITFVRDIEKEVKRSKSEFALSYEIIPARNGLVRKRLYDPHLTWSDANKMCSNDGKALCKASDICEHTGGRPFYGIHETDQWTPISDEFNNWLQIGKGNVRTCRKHNNMFGPPLWGLSRTECNSSNQYLPCPRRDYLYCCDSSSTLTEPEDLVDVMIYTNEYRSIIFSKYLRKGIDTLQSFDKTKIAWTISRKGRGDFTMIKLSLKYTAKFDKPIYVCQREVVPAILKLRFAYSMLSQPCESQGWKYLYHLYGMSKQHRDTVKHYVGVYEKRPHHTRIRAGSFPRGFQKENSYIVYSYGAEATLSKDEETTSEEDPSACGGSTATVTAPTIIVSPGYPKSYKSQSNCRWIIKKPVGFTKDDMLRLTVKELDLEDPVDVLTIRMISDSNTSYPEVRNKIRTLSGIVGQLTMKTTGYFELNFTSDETISRKGFKVEADIISNKCDGEVRTSGDLITSPNYPSRYPPNIKCQWSIEAPSRHYDIEIKVSFLDLANNGECTDKVIISQPNPAAITLCGRDAPSDDIFINGSVATIQFHSSTSNGKSGKGFALQVIFIERPSPNMLRCGVQSIPFRSANPVSEKIVGGSRATIQNFPWMMHITSNRSYCAGTLISKSWVLSAAHCLMRTRTLLNGDVIGLIRENPASLQLIAGRHKLNISNPGEQIRRIQHVQFRDDFLETLYIEVINGALTFSSFAINDIVLLKMDKPVTLTPYVQPICLPNQDAKVGDTCYIAGWGKLTESGRDAVHLMYAKSPILESELCNSYSQMRNTILETGLCAGYPAGGSGMCNGDSGGPLFCRGKYGNYYIQGITSWSVGCARKERPGVYTRVYHYNKWIKKIIESDLPKSPLGEVSMNFTKT